MRTLATVFVACLLIVTPVVKGENSGLMANPNPLNFNVPFGSNSVSQNVAITFNGSPVAINSVSTSTTTGQNWLVASIVGTGIVTTTVNPAGLSGAGFSGLVVVNTTAGSITFPVNLTVGVAPPATPAPPSLILILTGLAAAGLYQMRRMRPVASPGR